MSVAFLFALVVSLCAAVVATLLITTWRDDDLTVAATMALVLLPVLILTILAWREAL